MKYNDLSFISAHLKLLPVAYSERD